MGSSVHGWMVDYQFVASEAIKTPNLRQALTYHESIANQELLFVFASNLTAGNLTDLLIHALLKGPHKQVLIICNSTEVVQKEAGAMLRIQLWTRFQVRRPGYEKVVMLQDFWLTNQLLMLHLVNKQS